jgi:hypothetical protein
MIIGPDVSASESLAALGLVMPRSGAAAAGAGPGSAAASRCTAAGHGPAASGPGMFDSESDAGGTRSRPAAGATVYSEEDRDGPPTGGAGRGGVAATPAASRSELRFSTGIS